MTFFKSYRLFSQLVKQMSATCLRAGLCSLHRCRPGRICRPTSGGFVCDCAPADFCLRHSNNVQVCGSDRSWYSSHCELHRTACVTGFHLHVEQNPLHCHDATMDQEQGDYMVLIANLQAMNNRHAK